MGRIARGGRARGGDRGDERRGEERRGEKKERRVLRASDVCGAVQRRHRAAMCARVMRMHRDAARGTKVEDAENARGTERKKGCASAARGRVNEQHSETRRAR